MSKQKKPIMFTWGVLLNDITANSICKYLNKKGNYNFTFSKCSRCTTFTSAPVCIGIKAFSVLAAYSDGLKTGLLFIS